MINLLFRRRPPMPTLTDLTRAAPLQSTTVPRPQPRMTVDDASYWYAVNEWVFTAVNKIASKAAASFPIVRERTTQQDVQHELTRLIGANGRPNDFQDAYEFWEMHYSTLKLRGNVFWYWSSAGGGAPDGIYQLDPSRVRIVPGKTRTIESYIYNLNGREATLSPLQVTHFRSFNPNSGSLYGASVLDTLKLALNTDRSMAAWNNQFFDSSIPTGILAISDTTSDAEMQRVKLEFEAEHLARRRVSIIRAEPGTTAWYDAGAKQRDLDFASGRLLNRQSVYEAFDLPLGLLSEASTEAHARVAERRFLDSIYTMLSRTASKLTLDALPFWPGFDKFEIAYDDIRIVDWQARALQLNTLKQFMTVDEIRTSELGLKPMPQEKPTNA